MEEDLEISISNNALTQIANLAKRQQEAERAVLDKENELKEAEAELKLVQEDLLPSAMAEAGMKAFTLDNGAKITIKDDVAVSVPADKKSEAYAWLRTNDFGDLIKNTVAIDFGRGEDEKAEHLKEHCQEQGISYSDKESVHAQTLKAFIKEQMANGKDIPLELFGAFPYSKAVIK
jgi:hypothetical protein